MNGYYRVKDLKELEKLVKEKQLIYDFESYEKNKEGELIKVYHYKNKNNDNIKVKFVK